jgi:hypothetical protein
VPKEPEIQAEKPFDMLVEGRTSKDSRGDKTPLELFLSGVQGWGGFTSIHSFLSISIG